MRYTMLLATLLGAAVLAAGCQYLGLVQPSADAQRAAELAKIVYPAESEYGDDLDIRVESSGSFLHVTNLTPRMYSDVQLWLNRQYVHPVETIRIGRSPSLRLVDFINKEKEPFPEGGLLEPDKRQRLVLAELFDPKTGQRHRLVVQTKQTGEEIEGIEVRE